MGCRNLNHKNSEPRYDAEFAVWYDKIVKSGYYDYSQIANELIGIFPKSNYSHLLEIGIGTGNIAEILLSSGYKITGIDASIHMLERAQRKFGNNTNLILILCNVENLPLLSKFPGAYSVGGPFVFHRIGGEVYLEGYLKSYNKFVKALKSVNATLLDNSFFAINIQPPYVENGDLNLPIGNEYVYSNHSSVVSKHVRVKTHRIHRITKDNEKILVFEKSLKHYFMDIKHTKEVISKSGFKIISILDIFVLLIKRQNLGSKHDEEK